MNLQWLVYYSKMKLKASMNYSPELLDFLDSSENLTFVEENPKMIRFDTSTSNLFCPIVKGHEIIENHLSITLTEEDRSFFDTIVWDFLFKPFYTERPHNFGTGVQRIYTFNNGYGASVVKFPGTKGYQNDQWELAVLQYSEEDQDYSMTYDSPITSDVIGHLSDEDLVIVLLDIISLKNTLEKV